MACFRCSLSNSMRKVTHPPAGPCVGNRCHCRHFQRGPPGLGTVPTRRLRYNYVCDPTQMPLGVTEAITSFLYGVGGVASALWPPHSQFSGFPKRGRPSGATGWGGKRGAVSSHPRVSALLTCLLTWRGGGGGQSSCRQGWDMMRPNASCVLDQLCDLGQHLSPLWASVFSSVRRRD